MTTKTQTARSIHRGRSRKPQTTDWDGYYSRPYKTASVTRKITGRHLVKAMLQFAKKEPVLAELGGANSCFFNLIREKVRPAHYHMIDNNQPGLDRFYDRIGDVNHVSLHNQDVLNLNLTLPEQADLVFSVGLIEHFSPCGTKRAIEAHFDIVKPGGLVIMTFPTPTLLYRATRRLSEICGLWIFHDERPLVIGEVEEHCRPLGRLLDKEIIWPIMLTQYLVVCRKS